MAINRYITSKNNFIDYIKTELGEEYNCLELSAKQLDNIVNDTIQLWCENAYGGLLKRIYVLPIVSGTSDYVIGDDSDEPDIFSIYNIIEESRLNSLLLTPRLDGSTMLIQNLYNHSNSYKFLDYEIGGEYLEMYSKIYMPKTSYTWDEATQTLHLFADPNRDDTLALVVSQKRASDVGLYNETWVKKYAVAQAQLHWGKNLMKHNGVTLPGGASLNFEGIIDDAKSEIEKLETQLEEKYSEPPGFWIA